MKNKLNFAPGYYLAALLVFGFASVATVAAQHRTTKPKPDNFAQRLIDRAAAQHSDATEIGIATRTARGCRTVASTDASDIGEQCEKGDMEPMHTGKPYVEKERDGFDVSVPLRDAAGKVIGSLGIEFKPHAGQTEADVTHRAEGIAAGMAPQISSKAQLLAPAR